MKEELLFCPLGGSGEIGMNLNLYAYGKPENQKWIIVDVGVTFADDSVPGIDLIYPDPGFIVDKKDDVLGIILTHAHEDHIGAIAHIWPKLKCNIYATPFTAVLVREKFKEKKTNSNYCKRHKIIWLHFRASFSIWTSFCRDACLYTWPFTHKRTCNVDKKNESKFRNNDYCIS